MNKTEIKEVTDLLKECHTRYMYDFYLREISYSDFFNKVPFPTGRRLVYGCFDYFIDTDFVMSDKPDRTDNERSESGKYFEYESTFDKELTIYELLVKSDSVVRKSGDNHHNGFGGWNLSV